MFLAAPECTPIQEVLRRGECELSAPCLPSPSTTIMIDLRILQTTLDFPSNSAIFDSPF